MVTVALLGGVAMGVAGWMVHRKLARRSFEFRLGQRGLWIDHQFYFWNDVVAVTHYVDLGMLLIKVKRAGDVPLAFQVELQKTRYRRLDGRRLREEFERRVERLIWKSVLKFDTVKNWTRIVADLAGRTRIGVETHILCSLIRFDQRESATNSSLRVLCALRG